MDVLIKTSAKIKMIKVYNIDTEVRENEINEIARDNINNIFSALLGSELEGNEGEKIHYYYDNDDHFLNLFKKNHWNNHNEEDLNESFLEIAEKLMKSEFKADGSRNLRITKGTLFIKYTGDKLLFIKLEEISAIDPISFSIDISYSIDRKYYKALVFNGDKNYITVIDKNQRVAKYWSDDFLELRKIRTDIDNTKSISKLIIYKNLFTESLKKEKRDYYLKKITHYINVSESFDLDDFMENYQYPSNEDVVDKKTDIFDLSKFVDIDSSFTIDRETVQSEFKMNLKISRRITLNIKELHSAIGTGEISLNENEIIIKVSDDKMDQLKGIFDQYESEL